MHSNIFQIEKSIDGKYPYDTKALLSKRKVPFKLEEFPNHIAADYYKPEENEGEALNYLYKLIDGIFVIDPEKKMLTYNGVPTDYLNGYIQRLNSIVDNLSIESLLSGDCITRWRPEYLAYTAESNRCDFLVYYSASGAPVYLHEWIIWVATRFEKGDQFYIGSVLDYHY